MQNFIRKLALFTALVAIATNAVQYFVPYHWGNVWFSTKIRHLEEHPNKYNTFFFGSSRIYRQLIPSVFDRVVNQSGIEQIATFNLGAPSTFCPQTYFLVERFLDSESGADTKQVFVELMSVESIGDDLMHQERTTYWQNFKDVTFATQVSMERRDLDIARRCKTSSKYWVSYIENLLNAGQFRDMLLTEDYFDPVYLGERQDGFYSLDDELRNTTNLVVKNHLKQRKEGTTEKKRERRTNKILGVFASQNDKFSEMHYRRIIQLIRATEERGINLTFLITPSHLNDEILALHEALPRANKLPIDYANLHQHIYRLPNLFNIGHLNERGSKLWSEKLAEAYLERSRTEIVAARITASKPLE